MKTEQPFLGKTGTLLFLVVISAFPPLTTDLYLPALPSMVDKLNTSHALVNLTLSIYFIVYAIGLLFWGPLSEKFGRKPIMLVGLSIYIVGSVLCGLSNQVEMLIGARLIQAFGGSAATVVATAIVKDLYDGRERENIIATIMSLVIIAPMVAPVLGALLLQYGSWHLMFFLLAIFGAMSMIFAFFYRETLENRYLGSVLRSWGRLGTVLKNPHFVKLLAIFSITPMAFMAFLAAGSYIYIDQFGLSEKMFSYAFGINAFCASFAPRIYMFLSKRISVTKIITSSFAVLIICGLLTITIGSTSPWVFGCIVAPVTIMVIMSRVPGTNLMLDQQKTDTGSAVAIIQCCSMLAGSLGMFLVTLNPQNLILSLGIIQLCMGAIAITFWLLVKKQSYIVDNIYKIPSKVTS
ncbi:multidrug effflux MFS transporter [Paraglaciecola sp. 20A4]|uniref:Bcr/CflA family efflux MFS transporter n=1 Tax=Paraglaciecola sp. 20A4 TaxID=2687288 RepID=UPI00140AE113